MRSNEKLFRTSASAVIAGGLMLAAAPAMAQTTMAPAHRSPMQNGPMAAPGTAKAAMAEPLTKVSKPKATLATAWVQDSGGATIGHVTNVSTTSRGKAKAVDVSLISSGLAGKHVHIKASKLRYMPATHMLKATLTNSEIRSLANAPTQSP